MTETRAFLGLGGNLGNPRSAMRAALARLGEGDDTRIGAVSSLYSTPPWGKTDQPDFLNAVAEVFTTLTPSALLARCLATERALKRVRAERWGPRLIDMDVLWFGGQSIDHDGLTIPHPRMTERAFVMVPLAEIAPELLVGETNARSAADALDRSGITIAAARGWDRA